MTDIDGDHSGTACPTCGLARLPPIPQGGTWREDLRLFLIAWAAGFVFFLVLLG